MNTVTISQPFLSSAINSDKITDKVAFNWKNKNKKVHIIRYKDISFDNDC